MPAPGASSSGGSMGMFPGEDLLTGAATAGLNYAGTLATARAHQAAQESANATNIRLAQENRDFQERMSNTAHQREVTDLRAAGLNPILSVNKGASSPAGGSATVAPAPKASGFAAAAGALNSGLTTALSVAQVAKDLESKDAQIRATDAAAVASLANADNAAASAQSTRAGVPDVVARSATASGRYHTELERSRAETASARARAATAPRVAAADASTAESRSMVAANEAATAPGEAAARMSSAMARKASSEIDTKAAMYDGIAGRVLQTLGGIADAVSIRRLFQGGTLKDAKDADLSRELERRYRSTAK